MRLIGLYVLRFVFLLAIGALVFVVAMNHLDDVFQATVIGMGVVIALFFGLPAIYRDR